MTKYPKSIENCIKELRQCASNIDYCEIESLLTWSCAYLKDYQKIIGGERGTIKSNDENSFRI